LSAIISAAMSYIGCGGRSHQSATSLRPPPKPLAPTLSAVADGTVRVRWAAQGSVPPVTAHAIKVRSAGSLEWKFYDSTSHSIVASGGSAIVAGDNAVTLRGVTGFLEVSLAAQNHCGWSEWSMSALISCTPAPRVSHPALPVPTPAPRVHGGSMSRQAPPPTALPVPTPAPWVHGGSMSRQAPPPRPSRTRRDNWMVLYHATRLSNAQNIIRQQHFRIGEHGFIGPGIYFSASKDSAFRYCQCRTGHGPRVALRCRVNVGNVMRVRKGMVCTRQMLTDSDCDSFEESNRDSFMLPDNSLVQIDMASFEIEYA